jgi:hypothetical protein
LDAQRRIPRPSRRVGGRVREACRKSWRVCISGLLQRIQIARRAMRASWGFGEMNIGLARTTEKQESTAPEYHDRISSPCLQRVPHSVSKPQRKILHVSSGKRPSSRCVDECRERLVVPGLLGKEPGEYRLARNDIVWVGGLVDASGGHCEADRGEENGVVGESLYGTPGTAYPNPDHQLRHHG